MNVIFITQYSPKVPATHVTIFGGEENKNTNTSHPEDGHTSARNVGYCVTKLHSYFQAHSLVPFRELINARDIQHVKLLYFAL